MKGTIKILSILLCVMTLISFAACKGDVQTTSDVLSEDAQTNIPEQTEGDTEAKTDADTLSSEIQEQTTADGTEPSVTDVQTSNDVNTDSETTVPAEVTEPADTTSQVPNVTEPPTTQAPTEEPVPTETTKVPKVLGVYNCAPDRAIIYGSCEKDSEIVSVYGVFAEKNRSAGEYFYIECSTGASRQTVTLTAQAPGKITSNSVRVDVSYKADQSMLVFGGRNSRIFFQPTLPFYLGQNQADEATLEVTKNLLVKFREKVCKYTGKDTQIIYMICPNPSTVYYDEMRDYISSATGGKKNKTAAWQFVEKMQGVNGFIVPNMYELYDKYKSEDIFYRTDTHWSELGAFYAYTEMIQFVKDDFTKTPMYTLSDFNVVYEDCSAGDYSSMLGSMREQTPFLYPKSSFPTGAYYPARRKSGVNISTAVSYYPEYSSVNGSGLPTCYFMGDSYGANFLPFAGMSFGEMYGSSGDQGVLWNYSVDYGILSTEKPDYILYIFTDRNIGTDLSIILGGLGI